MTRPRPGACDCHTHVFGPAFLYPFDFRRTYTPGEAGTEALRALHQALGIDRVVIVQPSPYGTDNRCTLNAVRALGERARAVAVIGPDARPEALRELHAGGVRGIRLNLETAGLHDPTLASSMLERAAEQVAPLGWHVQVFTNLRVLEAIGDVLRALPVPLVVDHFGRASAPGEAGFASLLELVGSGRAWVKLSAPHRTADPEAMAAVARALIAANPNRCLWGSDWPHPGGRKRRATERDQIEPFDLVDDAAALDRLWQWCGGDEATWRGILVDNPAELYGFPP